MERVEGGREPSSQRRLAISPFGAAAEQEDGLPSPSASGRQFKGHVDDRRGLRRCRRRRRDTEMGFIVKYCHCHSFWLPASAC